MKLILSDSYLMIMIIMLFVFIALYVNRIILHIKIKKELKTIRELTDITFELNNCLHLQNEVYKSTIEHQKNHVKAMECQNQQIRQSYARLMKNIDKSDNIAIKTDSLMVSIIDNTDQEIWAYGYKDGTPFGVSDKALNFNRIVEIIEIALEQAKGELSISNNEVLLSKKEK